MQTPADDGSKRPDEQWILTAAEFVQRMAVFRRATSIWLIVILAGFLGLFVIFAVIASKYGKDLGPAGELTPQRTAVFVVLGSGGLLLLGGMISGLEYVTRKYALKCRHCGKRLESVDPYFAMATHSCPHCHGALFDEWRIGSVTDVHPESADAAVGQFTIAEIREAEKRRRRVLYWCSMNTWLVTFSMVGVTSIGLQFCADLTEEMWGEMADPISKLIRMVPASLLLGIGLIWSLRRADRACLLRCDGCGAEVANNSVTRATGNCTTCGCRVISDAPILRSNDETPEDTLLNRAEFTTVARHYRKQLPWCCVYGGIGAVAWCALVALFGEWIGTPIVWREPATMGSFLAMTFSIVIQFGIVFGLGYRLSRRGCCPHCHESLLTFSRLVQATGNCCHCGRQVLTSPLKRPVESTSS